MTDDTRPVALVGHGHTCPIAGHGRGTIVSESFRVHGRSVARLGDKIRSGAPIVSGATLVTIDGGRPVAREGDHTDGGGVILQGDESWKMP